MFKLLVTVMLNYLKLSTILNDNIINLHTEISIIC